MIHQHIFRAKYEPFHAQFDLSQGTPSNTLSLPIPTNSKLLIDWGDGTKTISGNTHTYDTIGTYDVKIYGQVRNFRYNGTNQPQRLMRIINWGQFVITTDAVFLGCSNLIIEDLETKVNVETNSMKHMFYNCSQLTTIPLLDTSNVTNMQHMFNGCSSLTTIPLLDTSNVTNMAYMFGGCSSLTSILLIDTSNVTDMRYMFFGCSSLTSIPDLDTSKVTDMQYMFYNCAVLDVDLSGWCVPLITSLPTSFVGGARLMTAEKLPVWGTCPKDNTFHAQFDLSKGDSSTTLTLPFNTEDSYSDLTIDWGDGKTTTGTNSHTYDVVGIYDVKINGEIRNFGYLGAESAAQKLIRIISWGGFIIDTYGTFVGCVNLESVDLESIPTNEATNFSQMFYGCFKLTEIPALDTSKVTNMDAMFGLCTSLTTIPLLDTSNVTSMQSMFHGCSSLITITKLNTSKVTNMQNMFFGCSSLISIPLLDTSKVTNMSAMFNGCGDLSTIPELNTSKVTNMSAMFYNCVALDADLSGWCVPLITLSPFNFVEGAPLMTEEKLPVWGTCPNGENLS